MMRPSSFAVRALKFLQKSMMFTPCGPSAVPTGGAGVALPAAIWSFTMAWTFLAIFRPELRACEYPAPTFIPLRVGPHPHAELTLSRERRRSRLAAGAAD